MVLEAAKNCGNKSVMSEVGRRKQIYEALVLIALCLDPTKNRTSFQKYSCSQPLEQQDWGSSYESWHLDPSSKPCVHGQITFDLILQQHLLFSVGRVGVELYKICS